MKAEIKIWILTGDKQETALNIGIPFGYIKFVWGVAGCIVDVMCGFLKQNQAWLVLIDQLLGSWQACGSLYLGELWVLG